MRRLMISLLTCLALSPSAWALDLSPSRLSVTLGLMEDEEVWGEERRGLRLQAAGLAEADYLALRDVLIAGRAALAHDQGRQDILLSEVAELLPEGVTAEAARQAAAPFAGRLDRLNVLPPPP